MARTGTYTQIATYTLGSANTFTFSSIPATYTDLMLVINGKGNRASTSDDTQIQINGDTTSLYSATWMQGNGTSAGTTRASAQTFMFGNNFRCSASTGGQCNIIYHFINYANTTTYKTVLARADDASNWGAQAGVGLWRNTAAINSIYLFNGTTAAWTIGTTATLYGIEAYK